MLKRLFLVALCGCLFMNMSAQKNHALQNHSFISIKDGHFVRHGKPYYYIGTNFWYGAILGSAGEGGNRERLLKELDYLKSIGIDNLRVLVGAQGEAVGGVATRVEPTLETAPGCYNDTLLDGLDFFMSELGKRDMLAVLYLNNSWEWSGGYSVYLQWAGEGKAPIPAIDGWDTYMNFVKRYAQNEKAHELFSNHVQSIISRTNRYTGKRYVDDPAIMSWQIGNEPRVFSQNKEDKDAFVQWMSKVSALIKSLDKNHLVSTGSEGLHGCEYDTLLVERIHADRNIDYINFHIWPYNWGWAPKDSLAQNVQKACSRTLDYVEVHRRIAEKYKKPMVMEEFGYPRDGFQFSKSSSTKNRDCYYRYVFDLVTKDAKGGKAMGGCNFWAWGGFAEPSTDHEFWQKGDDYCGDPAQEEQGLNSVFASDASTINLIHRSASEIKRNLLP